MKKFIFFLLSITTPLLAISQSKLVTYQAEQALTSYHQVYRLNSDQQQQVLDIQEKHFQKEAQLSDLKQTDLNRYLSKKLSLRKMTENSIFLLLNEQQQAIFSRKQQERAKKASVLQNKLKKQGASEIEIKQALLDLK